MSVGSPVDEREIEEALAAEGITVDHGNLIGGPFIPDGTVRILDWYSNVVGEGRTLAEAVEALPADVRRRAGL